MGFEGANQFIDYQLSRPWSKKNSLLNLKYLIFNNKYTILLITIETNFY